MSSVVILTVACCMLSTVLTASLVQCERHVGYERWEWQFSRLRFCEFWRTWSCCEGDITVLQCSL